MVAQDGFSTGIELGNGWSKRSPAPADALEADEQCEAEDDDDAFDIVDLENLEDDDDSSDSESLEQHRRYVSERDHLIQEIARRNSHRTADSMTDDSAKPETEAQSRHHDLSTSTDASGRYSAANSVRHRYKLSGDEGYAAPGVWTAEVPNGLARRQSTELQRREPNKIKNGKWISDELLPSSNDGLVIF